MSISVLGGGDGVTTCQSALISVLSVFLSFCRWLRHLFSPPSFDDLEIDEIHYDEANLTWDVREIEHQYIVQHCERCFAKGTVERP